VRDMLYQVSRGIVGRRNYSGRKDLPFLFREKAKRKVIFF